MFADAIAAAASAAPQAPVTMPVVPGLVAHIDGDYLAYHASGNDECTPGKARNNALDRVSYFMRLIGAESAVMHNTAKGSQKGERYLIATVKPYQGQRVGDSKPKNHAFLQDFLQTYEGPAFKVKNWMNREADDGIGACADYAQRLPVGYAGICTADKDMRMLPGIHVNWRTGQLTRVMPGDYDVVGPDGKQYGLKFFFLQMLMGDQADHCPGLPQYKDPSGKYKPVGEKTAEKLLAGCSTVDMACNMVYELYTDAYGRVEGCDRFCEQAALMWMRLDTHASITDFADHAGQSIISRSFTRPMWDAVARLKERVLSARAEINSFGNIGD